MSKILKKSTKVDKMEVSKQFPMVKEQLVYKLEGIALHEERKLEEYASVLASQVLASSYRSSILSGALIRSSNFFQIFST